MGRFAPSATDHPVRPFRGLLPEDLRHMVEDRGSGRIKWHAEILGKSLLFPRVRAVVYYRASQSLARRRMLSLAYVVQARAIRGSGAEISPFATIGSGLCLMHSVGIVIGPEVTAGRNLRIYHGVTLGDGSRPGQPQLGDDVVIGAGTAILGGVRIGDRVIVGANSVVTQDIPSDSVAIGAPANWHPRKDRHDHYARE